jgi:hypothetical protein
MLPQQPNPQPSEAMMRHVEYVQRRYENYLLSKPHVVGVGIGYACQGGAQTPELAVVVMVDRKLPKEEIAPVDRLPTQLEGVRIDVQEFGQFSAFGGENVDQSSV